MVNIEDVGCLNPVADREWNVFKDLPTDRIFSGERLHEGGQFREKQGEQRPYQNFGDTPSSGGTDSLAERKWPVVEGFDVLNLRMVNERSDQSCNETRMDVLNVRIDVDDDVSPQLIDCFPEVFTFAAFKALPG